MFFSCSARLKGPGWCVCAGGGGWVGRGANYSHLIETIREIENNYLLINKTYNRHFSLCSLY